MRRLRIAYVTTYDATNVNNWSGSGNYIARTLDKYVGDVEYIGDLERKSYIRNDIRKIYCRLLGGKEFHAERTAVVGKHYAMQVEKQIQGKKFDLIFSPGTIPIAYLDTNVPIAFWTDATFASMVDYYFKNVCPMSYRDGMKMEKLALDKAILAAYSSDWASSSAIKDYNVSAEKVITIPFGANIEAPPNVSPKILKSGKPVRLLFVGRDWKRKGGNIAVDTYRALREMGLDAYLTIVGSDPGITETGVEVFPFLDKNETKHRGELQVLSGFYSQAHFLMLPTRQEAYGLVLCEANSYGVPVLAGRTGGVGTIVKDGVNGFLFPVEATGRDYAMYINDIITGGQYSALSARSRKRYEEVLNWDVAGQTLRNHIYRTL